MKAGVTVRLREVVPDVAVGSDSAGRQRISPARTDDVAAALALATAEGWMVRAEGRGTWCPMDTPADLVLSTIRLDQVVSAAAGDLVATIEAGAALDHPREAGRCDNCGGELYQRPDDTVETAEKRLEVYFEQTSPLVEYYRKKGRLVEIAGERPIEMVSKRSRGQAPIETGWP